MSFVSPQIQAWLTGFSAGCDRLVHPSTVGCAEAAPQRRLIGLLFAAPFIAAIAGVQAFAGLWGDASLAAGACALFGASWVAALIVASTGRSFFLGGIVLAAGAVLAGLTIAAAGGAASPLVLLVLPLALEPYWVRRTRAAAVAGGAAALCALAVSAMAGAGFASPSTQPAASVAEWVAPVLYAITLWLRFGSFADEAVSTRGDSAVKVEELLDAVLVRLGRNGEIHEVSAQARRILDLQPELLLGSGLFDRIHIADRVAYMTALADVREGAPLRRAEIRLRLPAAEGARPGSQYRPFAVEFARTGAESETILAVLRDNSGLAEARAALAGAQERAESDDLAKSRFLAAVSHELRTPLNAIIGFSDMLLHEVYGGFTDPRQKEYAGLIRESGNHLLSVVNSILDVSKIESGAYPIEPEPFRFAEAAAMCRSMMEPQAQAKSIRMEDRVAPNAGEIRGDRRAIQQILINLVSNAVKFTPEGGLVTIGAKRMGPRLIFWVSDTGIGISSDDMDRLGQPFVQVHNDYTRRYDGTGLGLSLVKGLVALHEGAMSIESAPGQGTTVTVNLPCDGPAKAAEICETLVELAADRTMEGKDEAFRKRA